MMKYAALVVVLALLSGCGASLRPDGVALSSIQANDPRAEFVACGKLWAGLGYCPVNRGTAIDSAVALEIQGYYAGTIRVVSTTCDVDDSLRYSGSQRVRYFIQGRATQSCVVTFTVSPEYPDEEKSGIVVNSFKGQLLVQVVDPGYPEHYKITRMPLGFDDQFDIPAELPQEYQVEVRGCGTKFSKKITPTNGSIAIKVSDLLVPGSDADYVRGCIFRGGITGGTMFSWMVWVYDPKYAPLPKPAIEFDKATLKVTGSDAVSVVALDGGFVVNRGAQFKKFDKTQPHVLRLLTVKGRSAIGQWVPAQGGFTWTP